MRNSCRHVTNCRTRLTVCPTRNAPASKMEALILVADGPTRAQHIEDMRIAILVDFLIAAVLILAGSVLSASPTGAASGFSRSASQGGQQ